MLCCVRCGYPSADLTTLDLATTASSYFHCFRALFSKGCNRMAAATISNLIAP